jgi:hypothetical protein
MAPPPLAYVGCTYYTDRRKTKKDIRKVTCIAESEGVVGAEKDDSKKRGPLAIYSL